MKKDYLPKGNGTPQKVLKDTEGFESTELAIDK